MRSFSSGLCAALLGLCFTANGYAQENVLHVYNWSDYIAPETVANFEKETGIKVVYDVFDSNELLEAKLLAGNTGFDVVVPSASFLGRQIKAGIFMPLDKSKLTNYSHLDEGLMRKLQRVDPDNAHAVPYLWGTTGLGYNVKAVKARLGEDAPVNSWDLFFKPENMAKLKDCGISALDAQSEVLPIALHYLGHDPNSLNEADYTEHAAPLLAAARPNITYFHSSQYINDLANGDICVALGWSGDILQAATRAAEAGKGVEVAYSLPKEGTVVWFDMLAIPKDAKNVEAAHTFINYLMRPEVIAEVSNYVSYANGNLSSKELVDEAIRQDPNVYPSDEVMDKLFTLAVMPPRVDRVMTRVWTKVKTGL
jgi:putrescine transport system substrate-binding protein